MTEYYIPGAVPAFVRHGVPFRKDGLAYPGDWLDKGGPDSVGAIAAPAYDPDTHVLERGAGGWQIRAKAAAELAAELATAQAEARASLADQVRAAIERFVPPARALPYAEKQRQALALQAGGGAGQALAAEAAARGITAGQLADLVLTKASAWDAALGEIETLRLAAETAIAAATGARAAQAALANLVWPVPA